MEMKLEYYVSYAYLPQDGPFAAGFRIVSTDRRIETLKDVESIGENIRKHMQVEKLVVLSWHVMGVVGEVDDKVSKEASGD